MKAYLANATQTRAVMNAYGIDFQKKFGQNFLIEERIPRGIVEAAQVTKEDCVLEIGPGIGTMTQYLAEAARKVIAVEIDSNLLPVLKDTLQFWDNVRIIHADILKVDLTALAREENEGRPFKVVANLPYYITTPIIMKLLGTSDVISSVTVMVQQEVAQRIASGPGGKEYGAISLGVQYFAEPRIALKVPAGCFMPMPKVDSAVLLLEKRSEPAVSVKDPEYMFRVIKGSFLQRRKTLVNALAGYPPLGVTKEQVKDALTRMGKSELIRGETFTLEEFACLSDLLSGKESRISEHLADFLL